MEASGQLLVARTSEVDKVIVKVKKRLFDNGIVMRVSIIQKQHPSSKLTLLQS